MVQLIESVMFTSVTLFASLDAVRALARNDYEQALIEEAPGRR